MVGQHLNTFKQRSLTPFAVVEAAPDLGLRYALVLRELKDLEGDLGLFVFLDLVVLLMRVRRGQRSRSSSASCS